MPAQNLSDDMRPREIAVSVADATETLTAAGIADARVDAELLLAHMLGVGRGDAANCACVYHSGGWPIKSEAKAAQQHPQV